MIGVNKMDAKKSSGDRNSMVKKESIALRVQNNTTIARTTVSLGVTWCYQFLSSKVRCVIDDKTIDGWPIDEVSKNKAKGSKSLTTLLAEIH